MTDTERRTLLAQIDALTADHPHNPMELELPSGRRVTIISSERFERYFGDSVELMGVPALSTAPDNAELFAHLRDGPHQSRT